MKKSFQIWREIEVPAGGQTVLSELLKENFSKCTGAFIVPFSATTNLSQVSLFLKIAQNEILPNGTDASIITFDGSVALKDAIYDFSKDNIPARSSELDLTITNNGTSDVKLNFYVVLENE
ncbi:MAG: hypothetical protein MJ197_03570 [Bacteroidales bacterium]|nr:hypothetical protein [Bacteroidales bacterium]